MRKKPYWTLGVSFLLFMPTLFYAATIVTYPTYPQPQFPAQQITEWMQRTLITTLTAGHHDDVSEAANVRKRYMHKGWVPMDEFLNDHVVVDMDQKQVNSLHPRPLGPPSIVAKEDCEGASCWKVHQAFYVPELNSQVDFTALVMTADPSHGSPFVVKDMDIVVNNRE